MLCGCHHLHKIGCPNRRHLDRKARRTYPSLMILKRPDVQRVGAFVMVLVVRTRQSEECANTEGAETEKSA
jgi:hypothetical protein